MVMVVVVVLELIKFRWVAIEVLLAVGEAVT